MTYQELYYALNGEQMKKEAGMKKEALTGKSKALPFLLGILKRTGQQNSRIALVDGMLGESLRPAWEKDRSIFQLGKLIRAKGTMAPKSILGGFLRRINGGIFPSPALNRWSFNNRLKPIKNIDSNGEWNRLFERLDRRIAQPNHFQQKAYFALQELDKHLKELGSIQKQKSVLKSKDKILKNLL